MTDPKLIVTIDTEEDDWGSYARAPASVTNIERIPALQRLFDDFGVTPTYLVSYPIATNATAASMFRDFLKDGRCEVGAHCHPWNTPPFGDEVGKAQSMLCNLPPDLQLRKLKSLHKAILDNFGIEPRSFRAGRWGFDNVVARNISRLSYTVDSSIAPYTDWTAYGGPDHSGFTPECHMLTLGEMDEDPADPGLLEIPATIGFLQRNFRISGKVYNTFRKEPFRYAGLIGILDRLGILNKVWLSPEQSDLREMIGLSEAIRANRYPVLNLTFHSPSLRHGLTPFVKSRSDEDAFAEKLRSFLSHISEQGIQPATLSDAAKWIRPSPPA